MDTDYEKQATDFLKQTKSTMDIKYVRHGKYFDSDKESRDIYEVTITRGSRQMTLTFGQCTAESGIQFKVGRREFRWGREDFLAVPRVIGLYRYIEPSILCKEFESGKVGKYIRRRVEELAFKMSDKEVANIILPEPPTPYDVLACLQKYDVGTHAQFCAEYGYDVDSISGLRTYEACAKQYEDLCRVFTDEQVTMLQEIN